MVLAAVFCFCCCSRCCLWLCFSSRYRCLSNAPLHAAAYDRIKLAHNVCTLVRVSVLQIVLSLDHTTQPPTVSEASQSKSLYVHTCLNDDSCCSLSSLLLTLVAMVLTPCQPPSACCRDQATVQEQHSLCYFYTHTYSHSVIHRFTVTHYCT